MPLVLKGEYMKIAIKTLKLFEDTLVKDQGNEYRRHLALVLPHIADAYRQDEDGFRSHLGASTIGGECGRALWYGFRWFYKPSFSGRILRLFGRGHLEEGRLIALMLASGLYVYPQDENGKQFRISNFGGHFGGSGDGVALGVPDVPAGEYCLLEFKTHNNNSFKKLNIGVQQYKPEHYTQMQLYMEGLDLKYGLYLAVNKNDDEIYAEIIERDNYTAGQYKERANQLIFAPKPPSKINEHPSWYLCKWCDFHEICHKQGTPERNCRTCLYSTPQEDGTWLCRLHGFDLSKEAQQLGCTNHDFIR
jgi:hypothetical protein